MARKFPSFIEAYLEYTALLPSPEIFRKWTAIAIIAGALERKVWVRTAPGNLYPNLYVWLVAPPGKGKTVLTSQAWDLWNYLAEEDKHWVASASITKASFVDELNEAERKLLRPQDEESIVQFNALKISCDELGVLIPAYDTDFISTLTHLYDGKPYSERRRTSKNNFKIQAPNVSLLAGTQPGYLINLLPEVAWEQGLLSRMMLIFSDETTIKDIFQEESFNERLWERLQKELLHISRLYGKMTFAPEAMEFVRNWHMEGGKPIPNHPKLRHYTSRRTAHLLKLAMVASTATSDELIITMDHVQDALSWMVEAENFMPDIFKAMSTGGDSQAITDCWHFAYETYIREGKKPIQKHRLVYFLQERVPAYSVERILEVMVSANILEQELGAYIPKPLRQR